MFQMKVKNQDKAQLIKNLQLILFWALVTTIILPSILSFTIVSIAFCLATINSFAKNIKTYSKQTYGQWVGLAIFLVIGILSSELLDKSLKAAYDITRYLFLFYFITPLLKNVTDKELTSSLIGFCIFISYVFLTIVVYTQYTENSLIIRGSPLGYEVWGSHNLLSSGITTFFVLALCLIATRNLSLSQSLIIITPLLYGIVCILSRGNIFSSLFVTIFLALYYFKLPYKIFIALILLMLIAYIYLFFFFPCENDVCNLRIYARQYLYENTLAQFYERPLFGYGLSVFKLLSEIKEGAVFVIMPHNLILELLYSVGLVGSIALFSGLALWFYKSGWTFSTIKNIYPLPFPVIAALCLLIYLLTRGLFDLKLVSSQTFGLLAVIFSLLYSRKPDSVTNKQ